MGTLSCWCLHFENIVGNSSCDEIACNKGASEKGLVPGYKNSNTLFAPIMGLNFVDSLEKL